MPTYPLSIGTFLYVPTSHELIELLGYGGTFKSWGFIVCEDGKFFGTYPMAPFQNTRFYESTCIRPGDEAIVIDCPLRIAKIRRGADYA